MTTALAQIAEILSKVGAPSTFAARRTAVADDLHLEVTGLGRLRFPISRTQAQRLCRMARPARYGRGEQTLFDQRVRDTWEIPKSRLKIDRRQWNRTLLPVLEALGRDLGAPAGCRLKAELHSMLVYAPGQFFLRHQDAEKADEMVGTLVVTLPSSFKGGAIVVEHQDEKVTYRASKQPLSFIAFYADCVHEVRPVKEGHRIVLTYNLMLDGEEDSAATGAETAPETVDALAEMIHRHFETPAAPRPWKGDAAPSASPQRLVYLLDHQYTERGLHWRRLKGSDVARVSALRAAAERAGCEALLAVAEVQETWECMEDDWRPSWSRGRWESFADEDEYDDDFQPDNGEGYTLGDVLDRSITLHSWLDSAGKKAEAILAHVDAEEVCSTTPSSALEPYSSQYEGYMGNYGNTMDRWYRRAAVVLWPRERTFALRAEASPSWALEALKQRIRAGGVPAAREMAASLLPFWRSVAAREDQRGLFVKTLRVADSLDAPALALSLLQPFRVEALTPAQAPRLVALLKRYGASWAQTLLAAWSNPQPPGFQLNGRDRLKWLASLPRLCEALRLADDEAGTEAARWLLEHQWQWLKEAIEDRRGLEPPSLRNQTLAALAGPLRSLLEGAEVVKSGDLRDDVLAYLCAAENEPLVPCLVQMVRSAVEAAAPSRRATPGLEPIVRHCVRLLEARLSLPARAETDWSITLPPGCRCKLCVALSSFLADPETTQIEWPLAKDGRGHVHNRLDTHELPVRHETRRLGRPFSLILTKTTALFDREAAERRSWRADLDWLAKQAATGRSGAHARRVR